MPFSLRPVLALIVLTLCASAPVSAQLLAAVEGTGSRIAYEGSDGLSAFILRPELEWSSPSASVTANGSLAGFAGGGWTLQGAVAGSSFTPSFSQLRGELAASASGSTHQDGTTAGELLGRGRLHWMGTRRGAWIGGALGRAWDGSEWQADRRVDMGVWLRTPAVTLVAGATPTWLGNDLQFLDTEFTAGLVGGQVEFTATGGLRRWSRPAGAAGSSWGSLNAALWMTSHLAVVAAGGSYPTDYGQGFLPGSYLTVGLRLASQRSTRQTSAPIDARTPGLVSGTRFGRVPHRGVAISHFELHPEPEGRQTFIVDAPEAQQVDLIGDFTDWQVVRLSRTPKGTWWVTLPVGAGQHRMNLRVNGGLWNVPPGLPAIRDDFGGMVAILEVSVP